MKRPGARFATGCVVVIYIGVAVVAYWHVWFASSPSVVDPGASDPALSIWSLGWAPFAAFHHHGIFYTTWGNYPLGVSLLANTSTILLGLVAAPITFVFGPVIALGALLTAAMFSSAIAAYALCRRWTSWRPAAFLGGLLYGFSPYMVAQGTIHLNLAFVPIPPLLFLVLDEILVRQRGNPVQSGLLLGLLGVAQFFIASEVLATSVLIAVVGVITVAVMFPKQVREKLRHACLGLATAVLGVGIVLAYPAWASFRGPGHITGPIKLVPQIWRADLLAPVVPDRLQAIAPTGLQHLSDHFLQGNLVENGSYLGITMVCLLVVGSIAYRRVPVVKYAATMAAVSFVASLGARLTVSGAPSSISSSGFPLPEWVVGAIPGLGSILPARFALYVDLFSAVLLSVIVDRLRLSDRWGDSRVSGRRLRLNVGMPLSGEPQSERAGRDRRTSKLAGSRGTVAAAAAAAVALVPLVPAWPYPATAVNVPRYFTSQAVRAIPNGSVAVTYPYPGWNVDNAYPMLWQSSSTFRFKMPGGYFLVPSVPTGAVTVGIVTTTSGVFDALYEGKSIPRTAALREELRREWALWNVRTLLAQRSGRDSSAAIGFLTWVAGRTPRSIGGMEVWYGLWLTSSHG